MQFLLCNCLIYHRTWVIIITKLHCLIVIVLYTTEHWFIITELQNYIAYIAHMYLIRYIGCPYSTTEAICMKL